MPKADEGRSPESTSSEVGTRDPTQRVGDLGVGSSDLTPRVGDPDLRVTDSNGETIDASQRVDDSFQKVDDSCQRVRDLLTGVHRPFTLRFQPDRRSLCVLRRGQPILWVRYFVPTGGHFERLDGANVLVQSVVEGNQKVDDSLIEVDDLLKVRIRPLDSP